MVQKLEKPHPGNGKCFPDHFHQKFFYITYFTTKDPLHQSCETIKGTQKLHSVRTNGKEMEIEARLVPCLCLQCLSNRDGACPNKEYSGSWIPYDLTTGRQIIWDDYHNKHWGDFNVKKHKETDEKSEKKMKVTGISHDRKQVLKSKPKAISKPKKVIGPKPDFALSHKPINIPKQLTQPISSPQSMMSRLLTCTNLIQVHQTLLKFNFNQFPDVTGSIKHITKRDKIDQVAFQCIPTDALSGTLPVDVVGDGNCCPRSFSYALFGTEEYHTELRLLFLREALFNWQRYLDDKYLRVGSKRTYKHTKLQYVFTQYSGEYCPELVLCGRKENREERMKCLESVTDIVYDKEVLALGRSGQYMSIWQVFQAIFCNTGSGNYQNDFNRMIYPYEERYRSREPFILFWTWMVEDGPINHFIPLLKL